MALGDWCGRFVLIRETGESMEVLLHPDDPSYAIPGDCLLTDRQMMVGMWNGDMLRIDCTTGEKNLSFNHPAGILDFQSDGRDVYLVDFQGHFCIYQEDRPVRQFPVETCILGMKRFKDHIVIVGQNSCISTHSRNGR